MNSPASRFKLLASAASVGKNHFLIGNLLRVTIFCIAMCLARQARAAKPHNILFIICDQEQSRLLPAANYEAPARQELRSRGVVFRHHYAAAAMCSPSRAAFLTGLPPQRNGVFDQMEYPYEPALNPAIPTMGSVLKQLGYTTAYFGKFEMSREFLADKSTVNYSTALQPYGFDYFSANGDVASSPNSGYKNDSLTAGQVTQWLRQNDVAKNAKPFFLVASFINPHDIMYADANLPGELVQKSPVQQELTSPPNNSTYQKQWKFDLPRSLTEPLDAPGMPAALAEYHKGWADALGHIPTDRPDMWTKFYNYYLNLIRDNDSQMQEIVNVLSEQDLWKDTVVIFISDHGEMAGSHGGLRGKGPFAYDQNANVVMTIVHPDYPAGTSEAVTSHLDLLPTLIAFSGASEDQRKDLAKGLPGRDITPALAPESRGNPTAIREGALFNYVGPFTIDAGFCTSCLTRGSGVAAKSKINLADLTPHLNKRGFLAFTFDGRYKFARYYAPDRFNTPTTLDDLFANNDIQLFDLKEDPGEMNNLSLDREKNKGLLGRMNKLLNTLMAREVGTNNGSFLPEVIRPKGVPPLPAP